MISQFCPGRSFCCSGQRGIQGGRHRSRMPGTEDHIAFWIRIGFLEIFEVFPRSDNAGFMDNLMIQSRQNVLRKQRTVVSHDPVGFVLAAGKLPEFSTGPVMKPAGIVRFVFLEMQPAHISLLYGTVPAVGGVHNLLEHAHQFFFLFRIQVQSEFKQGAAFINAAVVDINIRRNPEKDARTDGAEQLFFRFVIVAIGIHHPFIGEGHMPHPVVSGKSGVNEHPQIHRFLILSFVIAQLILFHQPAVHGTENPERKQRNDVHRQSHPVVKGIRSRGVRMMNDVQFRKALERLDQQIDSEIVHDQPDVVAAQRNRHNKEHQVGQCHEQVLIEVTGLFGVVQHHLNALHQKVHKDIEGKYQTDKHMGILGMKPQKARCGTGYSRIQPQTAPFLANGFIHQCQTGCGGQSCTDIEEGFGIANGKEKASGPQNQKEDAGNPFQFRDCFHISIMAQRKIGSSV